MAVSGTDLSESRRHRGSWDDSVVLWIGHGLRSQKYLCSLSGSATQWLCGPGSVPYYPELTCLAHRSIP